MELTLEFMSQKWRVRLAEPRELDNCLGLCNPQTNTIILDPELPESVMTQTLFHEIIHIWEMTLAQNLTEQQVDVLATAMVHFFRANPEIIELLLKEEE